MSCIETFIPTTKIEHQIDRAFGNDWKTRDTFLALLKSEGFKAWYLKNNGKEFDENGDGRSTLPALRRYYNTKFFSVNDSTTIRDSKGRFTSFNARQIAIDYCVGRIFNSYFYGSIEVDTEKEITDENGNKVPNPNYGKTMIHHSPDKGNLVYKLTNDVYYLAIDAFNNIIYRNLEERVRDDFQTLNSIIDRNFENDNDEEIYNNIINKYKEDARKKGIVITDAYDLAAVFSTNEKISKVLKDRYVNLLVDDSARYEYFSIMSKIMTDNKISTIQETNAFALYSELPFGSVYQNEEGEWVYPDFITKDVLSNSKLSFFNKFKSLEDEYVEQENKESDPEATSSEEIEDSKVESENDNTIQAANSHLGTYDSFMKHADSVVRAYLSSLPNLNSMSIKYILPDGRPATEEDINDRNTDVIPVFDKDTSNELGVPTYMNLAEVMQVIYAYSDKSSANALRQSILRIARDIPGMRGLYKIYEDTNPNNPFGYDLLFSLYTTFGKIAMAKSQINTSSEGVEVKISNERSLKINALRMSMINSFRSTCLSIDDRTAKAELNEIKELIDKTTSDENGRREITNKIEKFLHNIFPDISDGIVFSYVYKDGEAGFKNAAKQLVLQIGSVVNNINNLNQEYNSLIVSQQDVYRQIGVIKYKLLNDPYDANKEKELLEKLRELRKNLAKLYKKDYVSTSQSSVYNLANNLVDYTLVRTEQNSPNIQGDMSSDVINNNMITNLTNLLNNNEALKRYGNYKFLSQQYDFSNILLESRDEKNNIINFGLFRKVNVEKVDEETGEITTVEEYEPTSYANQLISFQLFDGVRNVETGTAALYAQMTKSDYIVTAINEFFKSGTINDGLISLANYFTRIPSDATKTFVMRAPRYSIKGIGINGQFNHNHPIFQQFRNIVHQEIQDAVTAASKFFVINNQGYIEIDEANKRIPKFKNGWSNNPNDTKRAFDQYHTKKGQLIVPIVENGVTTGYKLVGNVFHSDRFVISTTQENFGDRLFGTDEQEGIINILYGRGKNGVQITEQDGKVTYHISKEQADAIDALIEDFIKAYTKDFEERIDNVKQYIPEDYRTRNNLMEFALNTFLIYNSYNDLLEGDSKFYKSNQDFLKRAKEMQGSGIPYGVVDYNRFVPDMSTIASRLDIANIFIPNKNDKTDGKVNDGKVILRNGFRAVTIKNTIRTSEEAKRLFGYYDKDKKFVPGSLVNRKHNLKSIIDAETAERLLKLYTDTKTNDAQSYITLDEWIRRITARGQFARYESLIRKLVDPNAELRPEDIDEFVQVQKNFYYDQHYNAELGVVAPRQIKNAEFVLIPRFLTYTTDEIGEDGLLKKVVHDTELMTVYNLMRKYKIDQLNTAETSKAGKANVLTLWNEDGILTEEAIEQFEKDVANDKKTNNEAIETFSYNNLYLQQDVPQHMDTENKAGIQIMKKILDNIQEEYNSQGEPKGLYAKKIELMDCYCQNIKESFDKLMKELDIPVDENGYPELEFVKGDLGKGSWRIKGLSYDKLFARLKEEANRTGVNSNVAEFFELATNGEPLMKPYLSNVSTKLESIIQSIFNNNITRQKLPGFHAAQVTGIGIAGKWTIRKGKKGNTIKTSNDLRYHPVDENGDIAAYAEVIIPKPKELQHLSDEAALRAMQEAGSDMFIGYRIPTEGKQSVSVMKVVGFLDKSQGSTIIVPDDWVSQTGADFDIDSIYAICPSFYQDKNTGKWEISYNKETRTGRNNTIVKNMIDILSDYRSFEENLSCSNFKDIIAARDRILEGTEIAKRKESRSVYNFLDQSDYQEDAISGTRLKGMSVTRDTLCSVCNTVRPTIAKALTVEYSEYDKEKNPTGVKYEHLVEAFDKEKIRIIKNPDDTRKFIVEHDKFGWSNNNRNIRGRLLTAYSSQTTAHILDAVKEGNIPNVNEFTFGIYKLFPDLGIDYDTAVSFMMLPGVTRVVDKYNNNRSVYSDNSDKPKVDKLVLDCVKEIAIEIGLIPNVYTTYPDVLKVLETYSRNYLNSTGRRDFTFDDINITVGNLRFSADRQIDTIRTSSNKAIKKTPVEETTNKPNINIVAEGNMTFSYNGNKRNDVSAETTFDAILMGERTSTTRYESDGHINYWKNLKRGDVVKFKDGKGREVLVKITKPLTKLDNNISAEEWSKKEGWSVDYFNSKVKPKLNEAWQMEYELVRDNVDSNKIEEILAILQFQYLADIAQGIGDYARVLNPDKFGAKVTTHSTRKALDDIRKIIKDNNRLLRVNSISTREALNIINEINKQNPDKNKILKADEETIRRIKSDYGKEVDILASVYPGIDSQPNAIDNDWIKDYISSTGVSSYPSLNRFLKLATLPSVLVEEQVFETERANFRETINFLGNYLGRNLTEDEYNKFKTYYLSYRVYLHTGMKKVETDEKGNAKLTDNNDSETIANNDDYERITGINKPTKFSLIVNDVTNPTLEEKEAFMKLTPGQKVLWIKQNASDAGIFKYLNVNLRNANEATNFSSTHQITFNSSAVDEEFALAEMHKAWNNRNWFVKETVRDLFKYSIVVENYRKSRRGITGIIVNDVLRDTGFNDNLTLDVEYEYEPGTNIYINYIRGHAKELGIPVFTYKPGKEIILNTTFKNTATFDMTDNKNALYGLKIATRKRKNQFSVPNFIIFTDVTGEEHLCKLEVIGDRYVTLYPLNKLMPNENSRWSVNESFNIEASNDFYEAYIEYLRDAYEAIDKSSVHFDKIIENYKFKSNKVVQVEDVNFKELAVDNYSIRNLIKTIEQNEQTIAMHGMYLRSPLLAKKRPSTNIEDANSWVTQVINGKEYIFKHIDADAARGQNNSINSYLAMAAGSIQADKQDGYSVDIDKFADSFVSRVLPKEDSDIADIVKQAIRAGVVHLDDVFYVTPRKTITMEQSIEEIVPEGVIGMNNRRKIGDENAADIMYKIDQTGINVENVDSIKTNALPVMKYIAEYTRLAVASYETKLKEFWKDEDGVWHSVIDDNIVAHIAADDEELSKYTALIGEIKSFISQMSFLTKNNISAEEQPEEFRQAIRNIIADINRLESNETFKKMSVKLLDYLKSQSDDDLLISQLYELTDGYQNIGKIESLVTDAQEAPIPLMQIILHIATRNVRGEDMRHFKNAKKFRRKIDELTRQAKDAGMTVDINRIVDEQGKLIQPYNKKFIDDYRKFRQELDDIVKDPSKGKDSLEYLKKDHEFALWRYHNLHQRYIDEYYKDVLDNEELILNDAHGFPRVFAKYKKLDNRRREILQNSPDGEITKTQEEELDAIIKEINSMTSTYDKPHIYEVVDTSISRAEYSDADKTEEDNSYEAAVALGRYIDRSTEIRMKYFNKNIKEGFEEALKHHLKVVFDSEAIDENGHRNTPDSILENHPAFEEYRRSKRWLKYNAKLTLTPEFSKIINKAYKLLGVGSFGRNFDVLNLIKTKGAKDENNIVDGNKFTDAEISDILEWQKQDYNYDAVSGYAPERLITNGNGTPFVWKTAFWENLKADGITNADYMGAVFDINEILRTCYDSKNKEVDTTRLTKEQLDKLAHLYQHLAMLHKTVHGTRERAEEIFEFISTQTEQIPIVNKTTGISRFEEEKTKALALWGEDSEEYKSWEAANTILVESFNETTGIRMVERKPNIWLYTIIKPKGAEGRLIFDDNGIPTGCDGNATFNRWIDSDKTVANNILSRFIDKVPTKYYLDKKTEVYKKQEGETEEQRRARIDEWTRKNHIYNPITHTLEPLQIWLRYDYKGSDIELASYTGASGDDSFQIYYYEPRFSQTESEPKDNAINDNYVEGTYLDNFKEYSSTNLLGDKKYKNSNYRKLNKYERKVREEFDKTLKAYANSAAARAYIRDGSLPAFHKHEENHSAAWHGKQLLKGFGWWYQAQGAGPFKETVDYEHDIEPVTPGLKELMDKRSKEFEPIKLPKRSEFDADEAGEKAYRKKLEKVKKDNLKNAEERAKIHQDILDRNWIDVMERFIVEAGHHNSVQMNKNLIYFGLDYLRTHTVNQSRIGKDKYKVDRNNSLGNNENYEQEKYGDDTLAVYEAFARRFIFNEYKKDQGWLTTVGNLAQQISSAKYMMLNLQSGVSNVTYGESQIAMEAFANEYFNAKEWGVGKKLWLNSIVSFGAHLYDETASDIGDGLCKLFNTLEFDSITELHEDNPGAAVKWQRARNATYVLQTLGEHFMQNGALLTMLSSHRLVREIDRGTGKPRYYAWSLARYIRNEREKALKSVLTAKEQKEFNEFISKIKTKEDDVKDYAWRRKDLITEYAIKNLSKDKIEKFNAKRKELEKAAEKKFYSLPTLFDQFELREGYAEFKKGRIEDGIILSNLDEKDAYRILGEMKNKVISVNKKIHGVYDRLGASRLEQEWYGGIVMQYHKHIWPGIMKRYRRHGYFNEDRGTVDKGAYMSLIDFLSIPFRNEVGLTKESKDAMTGLQNFFKQAMNFLLNIRMYYDVLPEYDRANIRRCLVEIGQFMSAVALALALRIAGDDEKNKEGIPYNFAVLISDKFLSEVQMYTPIGLVGEAKKQWSSPVSAWTSATDMMKLMNELAKLILEGDEYEPTYATGPNASRNKVGTLILRNIPIVRSWNAIWRLPKNNKYYKLQSNDLFVDVAYAALHSDTDD